MDNRFLVCRRHERLFATAATALSIPAEHDGSLLCCSDSARPAKGQQQQQAVTGRFRNTLETGLFLFREPSFAKVSFDDYLKKHPKRESAGMDGAPGVVVIPQDHSMYYTLDS